MTDIVAPDVRSRMMSGIRGKDTKPELIVRSGLHRRGFRFRLHDRHLPGRPDVVLPKHRAVVLIHGCFWHGHDCRFFRLPLTRPEFWASKIGRNRDNDARFAGALAAEEWRIAVVWECALRGRAAAVDIVIDRVAEWIDSSTARLEIRG